MVATIEGHTYVIPDLWIIGYCHFGKRPIDAIRFWHEQERLETLWRAQQRANGR